MPKIVNEEFDINDENESGAANKPKGTLIIK
jgi:hypothetical protein